MQNKVLKQPAGYQPRSSKGEHWLVNAVGWTGEAALSCKKVQGANTSNNLTKGVTIDSAERPSSPEYFSLSGLGDQFGRVITVQDTKLWGKGKGKLTALANFTADH